MPLNRSVALFPHPWPSGGDFHVAGPWLSHQSPRGGSSGWVGEKWRGNARDARPSLSRGPHAWWSLGGKTGAEQEWMEVYLDGHHGRPTQSKQQGKQGSGPVTIASTCVGQAWWRADAARQLLLWSVAWGIHRISLSETKLDRKFCRRISIRKTSLERVSKNL